MDKSGDLTARDLNSTQNKRRKAAMELSQAVQSAALSLAADSSHDDVGSDAELEGGSGGNYNMTSHNNLFLLVFINLTWQLTSACFVYFSQHQ